MLQHLSITSSKVTWRGNKIAHELEPGIMLLCLEEEDFQENAIPQADRQEIVKRAHLIKCAIRAKGYEVR